MASSKLAKLLVAPAKIASSLNWKKFNGAILSLDIHKDRIGMAIASHPTMEDGGAEALEPIHYHFQGGKLPESAKDKLEDIVRQENNICGVVVSWPLQKDTGHMGAACGRTIHVVEELLEDTNVFSANRPLCFWDSEHPRQSDEDQWGRCAEYNRTSSKHEHLASLEQYNQDENVAATEVWNDFVRIHWPEVFHSQQRGGGSSEVTYRQGSEIYDDRSIEYEESLAF
jgi:RNase H-fold protein (predicted Holliday junction resolvase)